MPFSAQRLRWTLIAGAILLIAVLASYISYGRYRALKAYQQVLARSGVSLTHDSNGVTWSQSMRNRKLYTIRAKKETSLGDGKYGLQDAELLLYTRSEFRPDRIYGSRMEYDQKEGILRARGDVFMDIQPPQALAKNGVAQPLSGAKPTHLVSGNVSGPEDSVMHVRTSELVYVRKLGVASTDQEVNLSYGGMQCRAQGAEFNSDQSMVRLLANVRMDGFAHGQALHIVATRAEMSRETNIATITQPVATSAGRSATADSATLYLRKDGTIETIEGGEHVTLRSGTAQITANRLDASLTSAAVLKEGRLSGEVVLADSNSLHPISGSAQMVDAMFDSNGAPTIVTALGGTKIAMMDRRADPRGLMRSMQGNKMTAQFTRVRKSSSGLRQLQVTGSANVVGESALDPTTDPVAHKTDEPLLKTIRVAADDLKVIFVANIDDRAQPRQLYGVGHTRLQQDAPFGEQQISSGNLLDMEFSPSPEKKGRLDVISAVQSGRVLIRDRAARKFGTSAPGALATGSADRAVYSANTHTLELIGSAHMYGNNASMTASTVSLNQNTQDVFASGNVQTTFEDAPSNVVNANETGASPVTHISSNTAHFVQDTQFATFLGTDENPAFMWRVGSQVKAATLFFDGVKHTFSARPSRTGTFVHAIFSSLVNDKKQHSATVASTIFHVVSPYMSYDDISHEAVFSEGVHINGTMGDIRGQQAVVFLLPSRRSSSTSHSGGSQPAYTLHSQPSPLAGSIDRVLVSGAVHLDQPGRRASGAELLYKTATQSYVLTGTVVAPPQVVDAQEGKVTGKVLLFTNGGSTIVVSAEPRASKGPGARVRTETSIGAAKERQ